MKGDKVYRIDLFEEIYQMINVIRNFRIKTQKIYK